MLQLVVDDALEAHCGVLRNQRGSQSPSPSMSQHSAWCGLPLSRQSSPPEVTYSLPDLSVGRETWGRLKKRQLRSSAGLLVGWLRIFVPETLTTAAIQLDAWSQIHIRIGKAAECLRQPICLELAGRDESICIKLCDKECGNCDSSDVVE